jgi:hypothetical protein
MQSAHHKGCSLMAVAVTYRLCVMLQGLVDAYVANSQQGKAVDYLNGLRDKLIAAVPTAASAAGSSSSGSSSENSAATAAAMPGSSDEAGAASSSEGAAVADGGASTSDRIPVDPVGVQLLLGGLCCLLDHYCCLVATPHQLPASLSLHQITPLCCWSAFDQFLNLQARRMLPGAGTTWMHWQRMTP